MRTWELRLLDSSLRTMPRPTVSLASLAWLRNKWLTRFDIPPAELMYKAKPLDEPELNM